MTMMMMMMMMSLTIQPQLQAKREEILQAGELPNAVQPPVVVRALPLLPLIAFSLILLQSQLLSMLSLPLLHYSTRHPSALTPNAFLLLLTYSSPLLTHPCTLHHAEMRDLLLLPLPWAY